MRRSREQLANLQNEMRARWQAGCVRSRPGRPVRQLDVDIAYVLALQGMTHAAIAQHFRCDRKTLERSCGAVLKRAVQRRALLLPRSLWQRASASNVTFAAIDSEFEAHYLNLEELEEMVAQDSGENNRGTKYGYSRSNKPQISVTGNAGISASHKNNARINESLIEQLPFERAHGFLFPDRRHHPQPPMSDISNLQQKFADQLAQGKELSPEFFPNDPRPKTHKTTLARGDHKNTPEPLAVNQKNTARASRRIFPPPPPSPRAGPGKSSRCCGEGVATSESSTRATRTSWLMCESQVGKKSSWC